MKKYSWIKIVAINHPQPNSATEVLLFSPHLSSFCFLILFASILSPPLSVLNLFESCKYAEVAEAFAASTENRETPRSETQKQKPPRKYLIGKTTNNTKTGALEEDKNVADGEKPRNKPDRQ